MTLSIPKVVWRNPDSPMNLAAALGQIAADLWLSGKVTLTDTPSVATLGALHDPQTGREVTDDQAEGLGRRCQAVA